MTLRNDTGWEIYIGTLDDMGEDWVNETPQSLADAVEGTTIQGWSEFLRLPSVAQRYDEIISFKIKAKAAAIIDEMDSPASGVNKANLLSALMSYEKNQSKVNDTITMFCHVPLSEEEAKSPAVLMSNGRVLRDKAHGVELEVGLDVGQA